MKAKVLLQVLRGAFWTHDTDADSEIEASEEDEDYEEYMKKAKRHRQYKSKRKEKADAAQVEEKTHTISKTTQALVNAFALFSSIKVLTKTNSNLLHTGYSC